MVRFVVPTLRIKTFEFRQPEIEITKFDGHIKNCMNSNQGDFNEESLPSLLAFLKFLQRLHKDKA